MFGFGTNHVWVLFHGTEYNYFIFELVQEKFIFRNWTIELHAKKKIEINQNSNFVPNPNPNNKNISNFPMRLSKIISSSVFEVRNSKVRNLHLTLDIYRPYSITTKLLQSNQSNTYKIQLGSNSVELFTKFFLNSQRCKAYPSELNGWILHIIWLDYILYRGTKIKKCAIFVNLNCFP